MANNPPEVITVIRSGNEVMILVDGVVFPWPIAISPEDRIDVKVMPGERPPSIRFTMPAERVEVVDAKKATRVMGVVREASRKALEEVGDD